MKKERVLHTRIPAVLEQELKRMAGSLRVPVSNLVRTILEDTLGAAEAELRGVAELLRGQRERLKDVAEEGGEAMGRAAAGLARKAPAEPDANPLAGVLGFQKLVLAVASVCSVCGRQIPEGHDAFLGVREGPGPRVIIDLECLPGRKKE